MNISQIESKEKDFRKRKLKPNGWYNTELYEAKLPPLLRYFHMFLLEMISRLEIHSIEAPLPLVLPYQVLY